MLDQLTIWQFTSVGLFSLIWEEMQPLICLIHPSLQDVQIQPWHLMELLEEREKGETRVWSLCRLTVFTLELRLDIMIFPALDGFFTVC